MGTLALVDGSSYLFRAYYAIQPLTNSKGMPTHVVLGFVNMLLKVLGQLKPDYVAVVWDNPDGSFRNKLFPGYKAERDACPEDLSIQIPQVFKVVSAMGFFQINKPGYEADDVIATLATKARKDHQVVIISSDKDLTQLVGKNVEMWDTMRDRRFDPGAVKEKFGVFPERMRDYLALVGDSSDSIPGVKGIGPKSALKLLEEYGTLENILNSIPTMKESRQKELLKEGAENARLSFELIRLVDSIEIEKSVSDLKPQACSQKELEDLLTELELKNTLQRFVNAGLITHAKEEPVFTMGAGESGKSVQYRILDTEKSWSACLETLKKKKRAALWPVESENRSWIGLAISYEVAQGCFVHFNDLAEERVIRDLADLFQSPDFELMAYDAKLIFRQFLMHQATIRCSVSDLMVEAYLIDSMSRNDLESLSLRYHQKPLEAPPLSGKETGTLFDRPSQHLCFSACSHSSAIVALTQTLAVEMERLQLTKLYQNIERPMIRVLAKMETEGISVDRGFLRNFQVELAQDAESKEAEIYEVAGQKFLIQSPKQLGDILFKKLKLPTKRKTKTGYSTDSDVLEELSREHPLPRLIVEYREVMKLKSTYVDALLDLCDSQGRVHTSFNQAVTVTGRLSSSNPNLQNIPIRTPRGQRIRNAFVASPGYELIIGDYSQIELRLMAHFSEDPRMLEAFSQGEDIHAITASQVFSLELSKVTKDQRRIAKAINFGLIYGQSAFGLSQQLGISQSDAKKYIEGYFQTYAQVKQCMDDLILQARKKGYAETLMGRRRYLPDLNSKNRMKVGFAERTAINTPLQGSAADIIKKAMVELDRGIESAFPGSRLLLQVHDELIVESPKKDSSEVASLMKSVMESTFSLRVPLDVSVAIGPHWGVKE